MLGVFIAVRIGGQEQVISWREHCTERAFQQGCVHECQPAEDSVAVPNPRRTCVTSDPQVSQTQWSHVDL